MDGYKGQPFPHSHLAHDFDFFTSSTRDLEAKRADRNSCLASSHRINTARKDSQTSSDYELLQDALGCLNGHAELKLRNTISSASATGSIADHTTCASAFGE